MFCFFRSFVHFAFQFWRFLLIHLLTQPFLSRVPSEHVSGLLPFFDLRHFFLLFLRTSVSLPSWSSVLSALYFVCSSPINQFIFSVWSFSIPAMSGSDACSLYSDCALCPSAFFLIARYDTLGKRDCSKLAFSTVVVRWGGGGVSVPLRLGLSWCPWPLSCTAISQSFHSP